MKVYSIIIVLSLLAGCANWTKPVTTEDEYNEDYSYIYGRFQIDAPEAFLGMDGHQTAGLVFKCNDGKDYKLRFHREPIVQIIRTAPAQCSLTEIIFTNADGSVMGRNQVTTDSFKNIVFDAGQAYYIGDFAATSSVMPGYNRSRFFWQIDSIKDYYVSTTVDLKNNYENFSTIGTVNLLK